MSNNLTIILSIIGCITGICSLFIVFYQFILTTPRIKLELNDRFRSYFFDTKSFNITSYETDYSASINIKISNLSSYPLTIGHIYVKHKKLISYHNNDFKFQPKQIKTGENSYTYYNPDKILTLPLRLDSFDTITGSIRIPFADKFIDKNNKKFIAKLVLYTPRKNYTLKVKISEYPNSPQDIPLQ